MGILDRVERRSGVTALLHPRDPAIAAFFGTDATAAGKHVSGDTVMGLSAVYSAVRILAFTVGVLPLDLFRRTPKGRETASDHYLYPLLKYRPNPWQTPFQWKAMMQGHVVLRGNAYSEIVWLNNGRAQMLVPLHPDRVVPRYEPLTAGAPATLYYEVYDGRGGRRILLSDEVLHLRGLSVDGITGVSVLRIARESFGTAQAAEEYAGKFYGNAARPSGILKHPKTLSKDAREKLKKQFRELFQGSENAFKVPVLEEGLEWQQVGLTLEDAQFLETRQFHVEEVSRWFNIPQHMLSKLDRSTNNNIEHQGIEFAQNSILPWAVNWEQQLAVQLLSDAQMATHYFKLQLQGLARGDLKSRYEAFAIGRNGGWLSANDVRGLEDENGIGPEGDIYLVPANMLNAEQLLDPPAPATDPAPDPGADGTPQDGAARRLRSRIAGAHERLFADAFRRVLRKELTAARRALALAVEKRSVAPIAAFRDDFYRDHADVVLRALRPAIAATADALAAMETELRGSDAECASLPALVEARAAAAARHHVAQSRAALRRALEAPEAERLRHLEAILGQWEEQRAALDAHVEIEQLAEAVRAAVHDTLTPSAA